MVLKMSDKNLKIGIVGSEFNYDIVMEMISLAKEHAEFLGGEVTHVVKVPGVYDMPLAVKRLLERKDIDGVVTLGAVIEGETEHDEVVIQHAARKITDLALEFNKPVGLGITGPGMTRLQASARIERAKAAVESVVKMHKRLAKLL
jgi:6,7-dimethyl-8-ribityllumazine synthase